MLKAFGEAIQNLFCKISPKARQHSCPVKWHKPMIGGLIILQKSFTFVSKGLFMRGPLSLTCKYRYDENFSSLSYDFVFSNYPHGTDRNKCDSTC
jgi:hypothetical protein